MTSYLRRSPATLLLASGTALALSACTTIPDVSPQGAATETIQILAINDFHGNIEPPAGTVRYSSGGAERQEQLGGAARLGATLAALRQGQRHSVTVAAGDLIGASPLVSAYYLDEPTIMSLNRVGLDLAAVGNHEFDRGTAELVRMQRGGCDALVPGRTPCRLDRPFEGAKFSFLAANVFDGQGRTLFPGTDLRSYGKAKVGFIGMTLKDTAILVSPAGTRGYSFADEAETANRLAADLKARGADTVVLMIHEGGETRPTYNADACPELSGNILPILDKLSSTISVVVSGHTHYAYVCSLKAADGTPRLLTSAGRYGYMVTDIAIEVDPATDRVVAMRGTNRPVAAAAGEQADIAGIVTRYATATQPVAGRVVGRIGGTLQRAEDIGDSSLGNIIADAQLAAARDPAKGGAQIAFINSGGVRTGFAPAADGSVTYGQIFALQPFGNSIVVLEMTGAELKDLLEQQFTDASPAKVRNSFLIPSSGLAYTIDRMRAPGQRIVSLTFEQQPVDPAARYRVAVNNFLASGGDGFALLSRLTPVGDGGNDLDALEAFLANGVTAPAIGRIRDVTAGQ